MKYLMSCWQWLAMAGIGQCLAFLLRWEWGWRWWQQFGRRRRARRSAAAPGHRGAQRRPDRFATVSRPQRLPAGGWRRPMGLPAAGRCRPAAGQHPRDSHRVGGSDHRDRGRRPASRRQHHLPPREQRLGAAPAAAALGCRPTPTASSAMCCPRPARFTPLARCGCSFGSATVARTWIATESTGVLSWSCARPSSATGRWPARPGRSRHCTSATSCGSP